MLAVLDPLAKPAAADQDTPDPRTAAQRMHDALLDAGTRLLRSDTLPHSGGVPATVLLTMTLTDLETRLGVATTSHGGHLTIPAALQLAADADIIPVIMNDAGGIAAYGRSKRHATKKQRHALAARDGGCSFPGCDTPRNGATATTSSTGETTAGPTSTTSPCSADTTTENTRNKAGNAT